MTMKKNNKIHISSGLVLSLARTVKAHAYSYDVKKTRDGVSILVSNGNHGGYITLPQDVIDSINNLLGVNNDS